MFLLQIFLPILSEYNWSQLQGFQGTRNTQKQILWFFFEIWAQEPSFAFGASGLGTLTHKTIRVAISRFTQVLIDMASIGWYHVINHFQRVQNVFGKGVRESLNLLAPANLSVSDIQEGGALPKYLGVGWGKSFYFIWKWLVVEWFTIFERIQGDVETNGKCPPPPHHSRRI